MLIQLNISINTLEKGEKGEEQNLQRLLGITETTADREELQKDSTEQLCDKRALKFKGQQTGSNGNREEKKTP